MFLIPFGSDSLYLEIATNLTGGELSPRDGPLIPEASHKRQVALPVLRVEFPNLISLMEVLSHSGEHLRWLRQRTQMKASTGQVSMWEGVWSVSALSGHTTFRHFHVWPTIRKPSGVLWRLFGMSTLEAQTAT